MESVMRKVITFLRRGLKSFFRYFVPEKVICIAFGIYVLFNVASNPEQYVPSFSNYVVFPTLTAVALYWIIALFSRKRRLRVKLLKVNNKIAEAKARQAALEEELYLSLGLDRIDQMSGYEFEDYAVWLLQGIGFSIIQHLGGSGDQGVDIVVEKNNIKYAVQCKCYSRDLDNTPVQEVTAGKNYHNCHIGVVLTNRRFTPGAIALAKSNNILLWDREELAKMIALASGAPIVF